MKKRLFCGCLCILMIASLLPAFAAADGKPNEPEPTPEISVVSLDTQSEPSKYGYMRVEIPGNRAVSDAYRNGDKAAYDRLAGEYAKRDTLPASYDTRNYNYVTPVKDQGWYGSCWAHAAMACVESYMIKYGIPVGTGSAATTSLNLSETQHAFFTYTDAYDAEGMLTGDTTTALDDQGTDTDESDALDRGGNGMLSAYTLMRWTGAADESVRALSYGCADDVYNDGLDSKYAYGSNVAHVQNSEWISGSDVDAVKRAIMKYGAGNISYYENGGYVYTCDDEAYSNHAITVVGWDDSIAPSLFQPTQPKNPGAWICKNSWGTYSFDDGYCYISYEDAAVCNDYIYFFDAEPVDNYDHNYQYDGTGCMFGIWMNNGTQIANVFTAARSESLQAISFNTYDEATAYQVDVYRNPTEGDPASGTKAASVTGYLAFPGYFTVPLSTPVALSSGDTFSVVVTLTEEGIGDDDAILVPCDFTYEINWMTWEHAYHDNASYYRVPGYTWDECIFNWDGFYAEGNFRIKAYTVDTTVPAPTATPTATPTPKPTATPTTAPTATPTTAPTATPTATPAATPTATPTSTPTATPTPKPTATPTATPSTAVMRSPRRRPIPALGVPAATLSTTKGTARSNMPGVCSTWLTIALSI